MSYTILYLDFIVKRIALVIKPLLIIYRVATRKKRRITKLFEIVRNKDV